MANKGAIERLDPRVREAVDSAIREGRATIDQIVDIIQALGAEVSRSAVGRYKQKAEAQMARYREAQEVAKVWIGKLQADPEGDVGRLLSEMLRTAAFQTLGDMKSAGPMDLMLLAKAIKDLAGADKLTAERILRVQEDTRKKLLAEQSKKLDALRHQGGVTAKTQAEIRKALGIA